MLAQGLLVGGGCWVVVPADDYDSTVVGEEGEEDGCVGVGCDGE